MTQQEIFKLANDMGKDKITSLNGVHTKEELAAFEAIATCYNKTQELMNTLSMSKQQKEVFFQRASENLFNESQLTEIAYVVCNLYKSEFNIKENASEILDVMCDSSNSPLRMSQIFIAVVKNLTFSEINEILQKPDSEIVEETKKVFCRHYNKVYIKQENKDEDLEEELEDIKDVEENNFSEMSDDFR